MIKKLLQIPLLFGIENDVESLRRLSFRKTLLHLHVGVVLISICHCQRSKAGVVNRTETAKCFE